MPRMLLLILLTLGQPGFVLAQDTNASQTTPSSQSVIKQLSALAKQGNAEAHYHLGMFYNNGVGVARSPTRALSYIRRSAEGGDPLASISSVVIW